MSAAVLTEYGSFQMSEEEITDEGYSIVFSDLSENRVLINKKDRTPFTSEEYAQIKQLSNVDYLVEDDVFIDGMSTISRDDMSIYGTMLDIENFRGNVDFGRMPENENEIVVAMISEHYYVTDRMNEVLNKTFSVLKSQGMNAWTNEKVMDLTVVGIQTYDVGSYNSKIYVSKNVLNKLRSNINKNYSDMKVMLNDKYVQYSVEPNENVERGTAIVDDEMKYEYKNNKIKDLPVNIYLSNIYYNEELNLTITKTYTKNNFKRTLGLENYDSNRYTIFINNEDYDSLYNKPSYQSSVYVKDIKKMDETLAQLEALGLNPKKVTDFKMNQGEIYKRIIKIIKVVVTIVLIMVLFFISYLIIKIILKSRNVYYTTLRMLGATYKNVRRILDIELFINSTLSYAVLMLFIYLVKADVIGLNYISKISNFLSVREYILMYLILIVISRLISMKFAKKLFKNTAINTYNEEV